MHSWVRAFGVLALSTVLALSCTDANNPFVPDRGLQVQLAPRYAETAVSIASEPITEIRLTVKNASTGAVVQVETRVASEVETPDGSAWEVELEVTPPSDGSDVTILMELLNAAGETEWSGETGPIAVSSGSSSVVEDVEIFPGPPANLSVEAVEITGAPASLLEGDTVRLAASLTGGEEGARAVWSSLTEDLASVDRQGLVTGLSGGTARIQAAAGPAADTVELEVQRAVHSVVVSPPADTLLAPGETAQFTAEALDENGEPLGGRGATWSSSETTVATVDESGLATALDYGTTLIEATVEGVVGSATLVVERPPPPAGFTREWLGVDPADPTAWGVAANWNPAEIPTASDTVLIASAVAQQPVLDASYSVGGLTVEDGATLDLAGFTLTVDGSVSAGQTITGPGTLVVTGSGATLSGSVPDLHITGDVILIGPVDVAGALTVQQTAGQLVVGGNTLTVADSLLVHQDGLLVMTDPGDTVRVAGATRFDGRSSAGSLTAGQLEVGGDFTQTSGWSAAAFSASDTHRTVLDGTAAQAVSFASTGSGFHHLDVANTTGVSFASTTHGSGALVLGPGAVVTAGDYRAAGDVITDATSSLTLTRLHVGGAMTVPGEYVVGATRFTGSGGQVVPAGLPYQSVEVWGDAVLGGSVDVSGALTVQQTAGQLVVGGNTLTVADSLLVHQDGLLVMTDPGDTVRVAGATRFDGRSSAGSLTAGQLEVGGDFTQTSGWSAAAFSASDTHRTVLDGTAAQAVSFASTGSGFHHLDVTNAGSGVSVSGTASVFGDLTVADAAILGSGTGTLITGGQVSSGLSSVVTLQTLELVDDTMSIGGSYSVGTTVFSEAPDALSPQILQSGLPYQDVVVQSVARYTDTCGGTETISGNLTVSGSGATFIPGSYLTLTVQGNLATELGGILQMLPPSLFIDCAFGTFVVNGNATFGGGSTDGQLTSGTLTVAGDFTETATDAFRASGSHRTELTGTSTVLFADTQPSHFHDLTVSGTVDVPETAWVGGSFFLTGGGSLTGVGQLGVDGSLTTETLTTLGVSLVRVTGALDVQGTYSVGRIIFSGGTDLAPQQIQAGLPYQDVTVEQHAKFPDFVGDQSISGNLVIESTGSFTPGGCDLVTIDGDLDVLGILTMDIFECPHEIDVLGNAIFRGGNNSQTLTNGVLRVAGNFTQIGTSSTGSFSPADTAFHKVVLNGGGAQTISFENPGAATSHFNDLEILNGSRTITLSSDVFVTGTFTTSAGATLTSSATTLNTNDVSVNGLTLDNVLFELLNPSSPVFDNVTFSANYAATATQFLVQHPGSLTTFSFTGLTFLTAPSTSTTEGFYLVAEDTSPVDQSFLTIDMLSPDPPRAPAGTTSTIGGATITWPAP